jgi:hypothetical protein
MGQPRRLYRRRFHAEFIGMEGYTRGSETSQYPEEQTSTEIPSVVASEDGTAQTLVSQETRGLRDLHTDALEVSGSFRNAARYRVKVPYAKTFPAVRGYPK